MIFTDHFIQYTKYEAENSAVFLLNMVRKSTERVSTSCAALGLSRFNLHFGTQHSSLETFINLLLLLIVVNFSVTNPSEIILICWFAAQETFLIIINVKSTFAA